MIGKLEETPRGSIIFLQYRLFPSATFFLIFWSLVLVAFAAFYLFFLPNLTYCMTCLLLAISNYILGLFFFSRQYKLSREVFHQLINFQLKDKD